MGVLTQPVAGKLVAKSLVLARMILESKNMLLRIKRGFGATWIPNTPVAVVLIEGGTVAVDMTVVVV